MTTIFYHADCPDGFGAAYAAWRVFGDTARYLPMHHGMPWQETDVRDRAVFILDFSFPKEDLLAMARIARSVVMLDHHGTARRPWAEVLQKSPDSSFEAFQAEDLPLRICFDMNKSGARLAWEYFLPATPPPLLIGHIEDIDLWRFALPGTKAFSRALRLFPFDFQVWDKLARSTETTQGERYQRLLADGEAIDRFINIEIERLVAGRLLTPITLRGEPVDPLQAVRHGQPVITAENRTWLAVSGLAVNANSVFASELGSALAEKSGSFGAIWQLGNDGEAKVSLRANNRVDVARIAENYGGGGHPNAAGLRLPMAEFLPLLGRT
jgi:uncharacterized protein